MAIKPLEASPKIMSTPAADTGRREQAKAERREKIMRAARDMIRETGDMNLSMRELARRAEVSVATSYNLFGSKRAVMLAVLEDERDFLQRYQKLQVSNAIDRIFEAHALGYQYFVQDPDFYRPLWRALLSATTNDDSGLMSPERQAQTRAAWHALLTAAQDEKLLSQEMSAEVLERMLSHLAGGTLLSWSSGGVETEDLMASVGLGYALILSACATNEGRGLLDAKIAAYQATLGKGKKIGASRE
ncbi:TetR/AcrR family transcriptional regulator [Hyphomonas sp. WL0036]|uniref:TetR/AcrR family transcriptional regulator n=1 Tax=Hyphomonas sediminis TaxID=2866160 RepID=UPI001C823828|nr:TetR/AcrR family transcriptional regulator [Hyphomonas sediminis]MBY9068076.1 TetR/AcrR family transcriptional regulator [Hyphomonas sediminis]